MIWIPDSSLLSSFFLSPTSHRAHQKKNALQLWIWPKRVRYFLIVTSDPWQSKIIIPRTLESSCEDPCREIGVIWWNRKHRRIVSKYVETSNSGRFFDVMLVSKRSALDGQMDLSPVQKEKDLLLPRVPSWSRRFCCYDFGHSTRKNLRNLNRGFVSKMSEFDPKVPRPDVGKRPDRPFFWHSPPQGLSGVLYAP